MTNDNQFHKIGNYGCDSVDKNLELWNSETI